jgi:hypothetical protein
MVIDNGSRNGVFLGTQRVQSTAATDGQAVRLGDPDGPRLTFELSLEPDNRTTAQTKRPIIGAPTEAICPTSQCSLCSASRSQHSCGGGCG